MCCKRSHLIWTIFFILLIAVKALMAVDKNMTIGYKDTIYGGYDLAVLFEQKQDSNSFSLKTYNFLTQETQEFNFGSYLSLGGRARISMLNTDPDIALCAFYENNAPADLVRADELFGEIIHHEYIYIFDLDKGEVIDKLKETELFVCAVTNGRKFYTYNKDSLWIVELSDSFAIENIKKKYWNCKELMRGFGKSMTKTLHKDGFYVGYRCDKKFEVYLTGNDSLMYSFDEKTDEIEKVIYGSYLFDYPLVMFSDRSLAVARITGLEQMTLNEFKETNRYLYRGEFPELDLLVSRQNGHYVYEYPNGEPFMVIDSSFNNRKLWRSNQFEQGVSHAVIFNRKPTDYARNFSEIYHGHWFDFFTKEEEMLPFSILQKGKDHILIFRREEDKIFE